MRGAAEAVVRWRGAGNPADLHVWSVPLRTRFRGLTVRDGRPGARRGGLGRVQPVLGLRRRRVRGVVARRARGGRRGLAGAGARPDPGQRHRPRRRRRTAHRDRAPRPGLPHGQGQGRRARPVARRRDRPARSGPRRARAGRARSGSTPTPRGTSTRPSPRSPRSTAPPAGSSTRSSPCPASTTWQRCAGARTCRSPPTSRSAAPTTRWRWRVRTPPTSSCSRSSRSVACARASSWPSAIGLPVVVVVGARVVGGARGRDRARGRAARAARTRAGSPPPSCSATDLVADPLLPVDGALAGPPPGARPGRCSGAAAAPDEPDRRGGADRIAAVEAQA